MKRKVMAVAISWAGLVPSPASVFLKVVLLGFGGTAVRTSFHHGLAVTVILGVLISVWSLARGQQTPGRNGPKLGEPAPDFTLSNNQGKPVSLKNFRGKKQVALVFYPALFKAGG